MLRGQKLQDDETAAALEASEVCLLSPHEGTRAEDPSVRPVWDSTLETLSRFKRPGRSTRSGPSSFKRLRSHSAACSCLFSNPFCEEVRLPRRDGFLSGRGSTAQPDAAGPGSPCLEHVPGGVGATTPRSLTRVASCHKVLVASQS